MEEKQINDLWLWVGSTDNFSKGVTNKQVVDKFGEGYKKAWSKTKRRYGGIENGMFYEDGKWYRWFENHTFK
jgi:hypothetical protein